MSHCTSLAQVSANPRKLVVTLKASTIGVIREEHSLSDVDIRDKLRIRGTYKQVFHVKQQENFVTEQFYV